MSGDDTPADDPAADSVRRQIEPTAESAEYELLAVIADVEGVDVTDLPPMYESIDHFVERLFHDPPSPSAQVVVEFSYYDYRITVDQSGGVTLVKLAADGVGG